MLPFSPLFIVIDVLGSLPFVGTLREVDAPLPAASYDSYYYGDGGIAWLGFSFPGLDNPDVNRYFRR